MKSKRNKGIVYLWDKKAGVLERADRAYRFTYDQEYLSQKDAQPVSLTLPLREEPYESESLFSFFLGLIPEGWLLDITSRTLKIDPENSFDILLATGGDCIGAVTVIPESDGDVS
jgi:serine/threonine-protein kinase HipA